MSRYQELFFVCTHQRSEDNPKGCCGGRGAEEVVDAMKGWVHAQGLKEKVRVVNSGCLNCCDRGVTVVGFSAEEDTPQTWYTGVTPNEVESLLHSHIVEKTPYSELVELF